MQLYYLDPVTVSSAHVLKREHLVPLYTNIPNRQYSQQDTEVVWVVTESGIGEVLVRRTFDVSGNWPLTVTVCGGSARVLHLIDMRAMRTY
jgi:hypothetical protein